MGRRCSYIIIPLSVGESPYETLLGHLPSKAKIMMEDNVRSFISDGFRTLGAKVTVQSPEVAAIRETKSEAEINILRAVCLLKCGSQF
jgi:hypothetical protein